MSLLAVASIVLIGGLFILLAAGLEIAVSMGVMGAVGLIFFVHQPLQQFAWTTFQALNVFALTCMPLFIFMGEMLSNTGVARTLSSGADKLLGFLPGGLASSVIAANALFGAMSGSSVAAAATFGSIAFPEMEKRGYDPKLAFGAIAMGGTLSVLIPPSLLMIVYGGWLDVSVARLFAAGLIPGIMLAILLMSTVAVLVVVNPRLVPKPVKIGWKERLYAIRELAPWLIIIALVLGVIFGGVMTPTEAAALGAFLSIIAALVFRQFTFKALKDSAFSAFKVTSMVAFLMVTARILSFVFQAAGLPEAFSSFMLKLNLGTYGILVIIIIIYLILGCFFDSISMLVLTIPFVIPMIEKTGFGFLWFGIVYVVLAEIGLVTPPFGLNLFALHGAAPKYPVMLIAAGSVPFLIPALIAIVLMIVFPQIILWLPGVLY